jgi:chaperone required for assembly of F1-ATPase
MEHAKVLIKLAISGIEIKKALILFDGNNYLNKCLNLCFRPRRPLHLKKEKNSYFIAIIPS